MPVDLRIHSVYLLASLDPLCAGNYYVGYTTDPLRRLKQHNGELQNGAHRTSRKGRPWCLVAAVSGFGEDRAALRFEWSWQFPAQALALKDAAAALRQARINARQLPYAVAILHRLLQVEPFASVKLTLFVLRPDLFFPLSVAVGTVVPPPRVICDALVADPGGLAGQAMAAKVPAVRAAVDRLAKANTAAADMLMMTQAPSSQAALNASAAAAGVSFHALVFTPDAEARLQALVATADARAGVAGNSPLLRSQNTSQAAHMLGSQDENSAAAAAAAGQKGGNGSNRKGGVSFADEQRQLELSDVDSSDTDTAEDTRRLEEVGLVGCTLCGRSAPSLLLLMRCPGNFVEQRNRRNDFAGVKPPLERKGNADDDDDDDPFAAVSLKGDRAANDGDDKNDDNDDDDGELLHNMPSCTMQCHVSCLAVWFQCCQQEQRADERERLKQQQEREEAEQRSNRRRQREETTRGAAAAPAATRGGKQSLDLSGFGLESLAAKKAASTKLSSAESGAHVVGAGQADCDNNDDAAEVKRLPPLDVAARIPMPPAAAVPAPCPICGCALHWPLLAAALKERLRRYQKRVEVKRRIALEMRRVGLRVQARETTARGRKKNAADAAAASITPGRDKQQHQQQQQQQPTTSRANEVSFSSPPGLPLAQRGGQKREGNSFSTAAVLFQQHQQQPRPQPPAASAAVQKKPGRTRFLDTVQGQKDQQRIDSQLSAGQRLANSAAFDSSLPEHLFN